MGIYGEGSCEELMNRRGVGFMGSAGEGAERTYWERPGEEQMNRRGVGFMGSAGKGA